jgi:hypothetical protein
MSLKSFVNNKQEWDSFLEYIEVAISKVHRRLEQSTTMEEIFRAQGEINALKRLKSMRDEVNGPQ